jgi:hypothetical protein
MISHDADYFLIWDESKLIEHAFHFFIRKVDEILIKIKRRELLAI